jgi:hypothetical protein
MPEGQTRTLTSQSSGPGARAARTRPLTAGVRRTDEGLGGAVKVVESISNRWHLIVLVLSLGLLAVPFAARAQEHKKGRTVTIGYLGNSSPSLEATLVQAFRDGLLQLGTWRGRISS